MTNELEAAIASLAAMPAATIYEAAGKQGALPRTIGPIAGGRHLAGRAFTVRCAPYETLPLLQVLSQPLPGLVLVVDAGEDGATVWGGTSALAAQLQGAAGLVTNGAIRDIEEIDAVGFPCFGVSRTLVGTNKSDPGEIGAPVRIGAVTIRSGDFLRGDPDGVVVVPQERIVAVAAAADRQRAKESDMESRLRAGQTVLQVLGLSR